MSSLAARFTVVCVSLVIFWSVLAGSGQAAIDPESIVEIWTFDEGRGEDVKDVSGNGNDAFFLGKPKWVDGQFGTALDFDSLGDVAQIAEFGKLHLPKKQRLQYAQSLVIPLTVISSASIRLPGTIALQSTFRGEMALSGSTALTKTM